MATEFNVCIKIIMNFLEVQDICGPLHSQKEKIVEFLRKEEFQDLLNEDMVKKIKRKLALIATKAATKDTTDRHFNIDDIKGVLERLIMGDDLVTMQRLGKRTNEQRRRDVNMQNDGESELPNEDEMGEDKA